MRLVAALLFALAAPAQAQFKCTAPDGSVSFQDSACPTSVRAERLALPAPSATPERPEHIRQAIALRKIAPGMLRSELDRVMGSPPDRLSRSMSADRIRHQLVYEQGRRTLYVYTEDGVVVSTSETER